MLSLDLIQNTKSIVKYLFFSSNMGNVDRSVVQLSH